MAILTAEQVAESLYNAGFREPDLSKLVAIGKRESSYKTDAHRTDQQNLICLILILMHVQHFFCTNKKD